MLTIRQYNKIMHDWLVMLTGLSGSNVRPQKRQFGFNMVDRQGKPIAFDGCVAFFYFGFEGQELDRFFNNDGSSSNLKNGSLTVSVVGDNCDAIISQVMALAFGSQSRQYLQQYGFAIKGEPTEMITDKEYSRKWFYRRTLKISLNAKLDFQLPYGALEKYIEDVPCIIKNK